MKALALVERYCDYYTQYKTSPDVPLNMHMNISMDAGTSMQCLQMLIPVQGLISTVWRSLCGEFLEKNGEPLQGGEIQTRVFKKFRGCLEKVLAAARIQKETEVVYKQSKKSRISSMKNTFFFIVKTFKEIIDNRLPYLFW